MLRRSVFLVGALLLAGCSSPDAESADSTIQVPATVDTLSNGLRLIVHEDHSAPIVAVDVWYHVGSGSEKPGRTGFVHLFEHLMFMGSEHAEYPQFDLLLEGAGASNNGSTTPDRTNYYEWGPVNALPLMLWLEADRMGWLLPTMSLEKLNAQRDVVKNERRQSYENQPYGLVGDILPPLLFPAGHPYNWPVIGSMADLSAASVEDVSQFFRMYYAPNNAVIAVAGDVKRDSVLKLVEAYFGAIPHGPEIAKPEPAQPSLSRDTLLLVEDRVQFPRLYYSWPGTREWTPDATALEVAATILSGSKNARLTRKLVYQDQSATGVFASADSRRLAGSFDIVATAKPGHGLRELQASIDQVLRVLADSGPTSHELEQARNSLEADFLRSIQTVQSKADALNSYYYMTGHPDAFQEDLNNHLKVTAEDVQRVVRQYLLGPRAIIGVMPMGKKNDATLAAGPREIQ